MPRLLDHTGVVVQPSAGPTLRLPGDTAFSSLAGRLDGVTEVIIEFPLFRDGRGFSLARALREHGGFTGEITAAGHIIADQFPLLLRSGFSRVEISDDADISTWTRALTALPAVYQAGVGESLASPTLGRFVGS